MSDYEDRRQEKLARFEELAKKNQQAGEQTLESVREERSHIPLGQPILVGHHSEGRHRRHLDSMHNKEGKGYEALDKAKHYERKAENIRNPRAISSDDPEAVTQLKAKLVELEEKREAIKEENKKARKNKEEQIPRYVLTNLGANIRSVKKRIAILIEKNKLQHAEWMVGEVKIVQNVDANRLQLFFPGKPELMQRTKLKQYGFRWSPRNGCWQRQISKHAEYAANIILGKENK